MKSKVELPKLSLIIKIIKNLVYFKDLVLIIPQKAGCKSLCTSRLEVNFRRYFWKKRGVSQWTPYKARQFSSSIISTLSTTKSKLSKKRWAENMLLCYQIFTLVMCLFPLHRVKNTLKTFLGKVLCKSCLLLASIFIFLISLIFLNKLQNFHPNFSPWVKF